MVCGMVCGVVCAVACTVRVADALRDASSYIRVLLSPSFPGSRRDLVHRVGSLGGHLLLP